jgi:hypothetical protein
MGEVKVSMDQVVQEVSRHEYEDIMLAQVLSPLVWLSEG